MKKKKKSKDGAKSTRSQEHSDLFLVNKVLSNSIVDKTKFKSL